MQSYTEEFYEFVRKGAKESAKEIIPIVFEFIQPKSVIDVGCGLGTWLSVFQAHGVEDVWGIDCDYVDQNLLEIPKERFLTFDLKSPFRLNREFDLVVSLEVGEHLPNECAETFVDSLTKLAPVILFSAAIPFQGGTKHINEQWQDYWVKHFQNKGYVAIDCIRNRVWENERVEFWYAQNMLVFAKREYLELENAYLLKQQFERTNIFQRSIVHPSKYLEVVEKYLAETKAAQWYAAEAEKYLAAAQPKNMPLKKVISALPIVIVNTLKRKLFEKESLT
jgi:SAM-dependent methyltransferase